MKPIHVAVNDIVGASLAMLARAFEGLPDGALDWTPVSGTNSLTVLATHSITSTRFWLAAGAGLQPDRTDYSENVCARAFRARGATAAGLVAEIAAAREDLRSILARADPSVLDREVPGTEDDGGRPRTGAACLVHALGHLREHVGQAQLTRDLWLAASREGH